MLTPSRTTALLTTAAALVLSPTGAHAASDTPTATTSPSAACERQPSDPLYAYGPGVVHAGGEGSGLVTEPLLAGSTVRVLAYTQPVTSYSVVRTQVVETAGRYQTVLRPPRSTRFYVEVSHPDCGVRRSRSEVVAVSPVLSLGAVRRGVRDYTFTGRGTPVREGKLLSLYRVVGEGERVLTAQTRWRADGTYRFDRRFTGSGAWNFVVESGADVQNARGSSQARYTVVH